MTENDPKNKKENSEPSVEKRGVTDSKGDLIPPPEGFYYSNNKAEGATGIYKAEFPDWVSSLSGTPPPINMPPVKITNPEETLSSNKEPETKE